MNGWEKQQAENERNRQIEERARQDREASRHADSRSHTSSTDHKRYMDSYNK